MNNDTPNVLSQNEILSFDILNKKKKNELKNLAKNYGVKKIGNLKKVDLINEILQNFEKRKISQKKRGVSHKTKTQKEIKYVNGHKLWENDKNEIANLDEVKQNLQTLAKDRSMNTLYLYDIKEAVKKLSLIDEDFNKLLAYFKEKKIKITNLKNSKTTKQELVTNSANYYSDVDYYDVKKNLSDKVKIHDPVKRYLKEIAKPKLLKGLEREQEWGKVLEEGKALRKKAEQILTTAKSTSKKYKEALRWKEEGDEKYFRAKKTFIKANLRLVVSNAKKYTNKGLSFLDLIQEGNIGLMKAIDKYDWTKQFKFATYATWWIRQAITRSIADQAKTIRIPVHMVETINKVNKISRLLIQQIGREPICEEIVEEMYKSELEQITSKKERNKKFKVYLEKIKHIQKIDLPIISLEKPVGQEKDSISADFIEDQTLQSPVKISEKEALKVEINNLLLKIEKREAIVLCLRYGLQIPSELKKFALENGLTTNDIKVPYTHTLEDVGNKLNVTRERIRQIEAKAIRRLKPIAKEKKINDFVDIGEN